MVDVSVLSSCQYYDANSVFNNESCDTHSFNMFHFRTDVNIYRYKNS